MAPGFSIRGYAESMRGQMTEELIRTFGESARDLPPIVCKQYRWWKNNLAVFKAAQVQEAPGKLSISGHSEAVPSILSKLDSNTETQQNILRKLTKRKRTSRVEEVEATVVVGEAASLAKVQGHEVEDSFTREVVNQLEPNDKVCPADGNLDQMIGDQYNEGIRHGNFPKKDWHENVEQEDLNKGNLHGASKDNESKMKEWMESMKLKVSKSPYAGIKKKSVPRENTDGASIGKVTKGLKLSDLELRAITFVLEALAKDSNKDLVDIDGITVTATHLKCLVRPVKENAVKKWLCSRIIDCYAAMLNSDWNEGNEMKHALYGAICQWLRSIGQAWIQTGEPWWRLCRHFVKKLVGHDMVFIPMNNTENHWWLCVLYPARNEFQVLDSFNMPKDYEQETMELRCGIHSILQAFISSSEKLQSRWSNYDILKWDVVVKKNIPQQEDVCSCGIFTIKYMQYWNGSEITSPFSQTDMETMRKEMPAELIMSPFNKLTSSKEHVLAM